MLFFINSIWLWLTEYPSVSMLVPIIRDLEKLTVLNCCGRLLSYYT